MIPETEMEEALDKLELIEGLGVHIPAKSRNAIIVAILSGCYDSCMPDRLMSKPGNRGSGDTIIAKEETDDLRPIFGL
jgi:hypothetical protein